jgi:Flp pilus assembly protein TadG
MIGRIKRPRGRGQALVEFALVLPLVMLLIFGAVDFGRAIYAYNSMAEAARQANRTAIVNQDAPTVKNVAVAAAPASGLVAAGVSVCYKTPDTLQVDCSSPLVDPCAPLQLGCLAFVTTTTKYYPITPVLSSVVGILTLKSTSVGPIESVCPTAAQPTCP